MSAIGFPDDAWLVIFSPSGKPLLGFLDEMIRTGHGDF